MLNIHATLAGVGGDAALGALIAFGIAVLTTPVGVSGAVFLVPVQVSLLQTPSPAVTPTNLIYNLVAIPGALLRFRREGRLGGPLTRLLILGTLPGMVVGAAIRAELLDSSHAFLLVIAAVLAPLGAWLVFARPTPPAAPLTPARSQAILLLALTVGIVGGVYGIGGGSILGPVLVGLGYSVLEVAPAALTATFLTSLAGIATFSVLSLAGAYLGAGLQSRLPEALLRRGLGAVALALGLGYAGSTLGLF